ncbi:hypothetical protein HF925_08695 [Acidithiobacillus ferriphilus]|uniref:phospholipase D family protein n=1 Tax=Acidithiobacillus ferriphilus TaxID=1689834 RepID=UPI001C06A38B|nr:phospholipase D family protein [Acidithiobacillus ferriphilus]MBU2848655.1 hypothetical protein [Acidithiobacillus ferriphilus]
MLLWEGIGARLDALARATTTEVVVVAPFIKRIALQRVLAGAPLDATVLCVTRWRVDELARGVSDLEVYLDLVERGNARMLLVKELHAKYFRFDRDVIVGSCNITGAALGYKDPSNLELAVALQAGEQTSAFEARVTADAVPVKHGMYDVMKRIIESMPMMPTPSDANEGADVDPLLSARSTLGATKDWAQWLPTCRAPNALYDAYAGHLDDLTLATRVAAQQDLQLLDLPRGLTRAQFDAFVAGTILSSPVVARLAEFAVTPRRFGEMKDLLHVIAPATSATNDWQTTMRWLLHFAPDRFTMRVANYSEIFTANW